MQKTFLFLLTFITFFGFSQHEGIPQDNLYDNWKSSTVLDIENNENYSSFHGLDSITQHHKVFFVGENHQFQNSNAQLQLKMFKYLHQNAGVNTLLLEFGYSRGWLVTRYIHTGDEKYLDILDRYSYSAYVDVYKGLRDYQLQLDSTSKEKIEVIGIDVERFYILSVKVLSMLLPETIPQSDSLKLAIESIHGLAVYNDHLYENRDVDDKDPDSQYVKFGYPSYMYSNEATISSIINNFHHNRAEYQLLLLDKFEVFEKVLLELEGKIKHSLYVEKRMVQQYVFREQYMYERFLEVCEQYPTRKFYAQFGRCHTATREQQEACSWFSYNSIAHRINNTPGSPAYDLVCSIGTFYPKSRTYIRNKKINSQLERLVDAANPDSLTLFELKKDTSVAADDDLYNKFEYVIINPMTMEKDKKNSSEEPESDDEDHDISFFDAHFQFDLFETPTDILFNQLTDIQLVNRQQFGFRTGNIRLRGLVSTFDYGYSFQNLDLNAGGEAISSGYRLGYNIGYQFFKKKTVTFHFTSGLLVGRWKIKTKDAVATANSWVTAGNNKYKNPFLAGKLEADLRFNWETIGVGIKGGYYGDFSNPEWKQSKNHIENTDYTLTGPYVGVYIGINMIDLDEDE